MWKVTIGDTAIHSEIGVKETGQEAAGLCYVLDVGTTTLVMALVSLDEKKIIKVITEPNPQRMYGADVISRMEYCMRHGAWDLQVALISKINQMATSFPTSQVECMYVAGNTTMLHLMKGVDCSSMGRAPYQPIFLEKQQMEGNELGLSFVGEIILLPSISAFVGADLVAGIRCAGQPKEGYYHFLVDLGTNAEIILYSSENIVCTSAAAGPCFEGANISCGMCATKGAIYAYSAGEISTIDDMPARGICGTGLVDVIAEFLRTGLIDDTGYMGDYDGKVAEGVYLTQQDIRQFQNAKSAICSAITVLMEMEHVVADRIDKVYVAGGFAAKLNVKNAAMIGLIPESLAAKCEPIYNSSLLGTIQYACDKGEVSEELITATYVDLSANPRFSELFIENMYLRKV